MKITQSRNKREGHRVGRVGGRWRRENLDDAMALTRQMSVQYPEWSAIEREVFEAMFSMQGGPIWSRK